MHNMIFIKFKAIIVVTFKWVGYLVQTDGGMNLMKTEGILKIGFSENLTHFDKPKIIVHPNAWPEALSIEPR